MKGDPGIYSPGTITPFLEPWRKIRSLLMQSGFEKQRRSTRKKHGLQNHGDPAQILYPIVGPIVDPRMEKYCPSEN